MRIVFLVLAAVAAQRNSGGLVVVDGDAAADPHRKRLRTFALPRSGTVQIRQVIDTDSIGPGASQWDGGFVLADFIERTSVSIARCAAGGCDLTSRYANATVLELGAGAGGLVAIALLNSGAARVLATDGDPAVLDTLDANIRANTRGGAAFLGAARLRWDDERDVAAARATLGLPIDLIVAADVAFRTSDTVALIDAVAALSLEARPEILLAHTFRFWADDERFLDDLDARFLRTEVSKAEIHPRAAGGIPTSLYRLLLRS